MAGVSTYLNFMGDTEEAFRFYGAAFGTEPGEMMRMGDLPPNPDMPAIPDEEKRLVMHVDLPILGGHVLHGTDMVRSMGHELKLGNNISINLEPDTRAEADRLFAALSEGGSVDMPMMEMFWGAYWGSFVDRFGIRWMINCNAPAA